MEEDIMYDIPLISKKEEKRSQKEIKDELSTLLFPKITDNVNIPRSVYDRIINYSDRDFEKFSNLIKDAVYDFFGRETYKNELVRAQGLPPDFEAIIIPQITISVTDPDGTPNYMIITRDFNYDLDSSYDVRDKDSLKYLLHWFQKQPFFIFQFQLERPEREYDSHLVFIKKNGLKQLELIDSDGNNWDSIKFIMNNSIVYLIKRIFSKLKFTKLDQLSCPRVQSYSSCFLWSLYFGIFNEKSPQQAIKLINKVLDKNKIQVSSDPIIKTRQREAVILILFQNLVSLNWVNPAGIDIVEYKKGLGRKYKIIHRENVLNKYGLIDKSYSIQELSKITKISSGVLQEVYNRGIGAYTTNPESVRIKGTFKKGPAPMSQKLSKEQWAMARVYSFIDGNTKHDNDLRKCRKCGLNKF